MLQNNLLYCTWFLLKTALKSLKKLVVASIAVFGEAVGLKNVKLYHLLGNLQNRDAPLTKTRRIERFYNQYQRKLGTS